MGPATFWRLLQEHGSAQDALEALPRIAAEAGVAGYEPFPEADAAGEARAAAKAGARLILRSDADYPARLAEIPDAPPLLWALGDPRLLARPIIALVGARNASSLGGRMARHLAQALAEAGFVIVSGLARGIDAVAHEASLATGTVAVMAGGIDVIYPPENADLAQRITGTGLRLSEHPPGLQPQARHFPLRNRIISGLSQAVVVIEAATQSGSLITARLALDQGREVFAVPGHPFDGRAGGCNSLIRDGATLIRGPRDVIDALAGLAALPEASLAAPRPAAPPAGGPPRTRSLADTAALHRQILDRLGPSPVPEDQLIRDLAVPAAAVAPELVALELDGRIQRQPGGLLSRLS